MMNKKAEELGLENTHFVTPHGLDKDEHYTTAYELAIIADYAMNIEKFREVVSTKRYTVTINGYPKSIGNTNELLGYLEGVNGVKTGFTNKAGRCLVTSVSRNNFDIITVVLGADTKKIRTKDSIRLIEYVYKNYELVDIKSLIEEEFEKWCNINKRRISIDKGVSNNLNISLREYPYTIYPVLKQNKNRVNIYSEILTYKLEAPVYENTKVGQMVVEIQKEKIMDIDIVISNSIERKNAMNYFIEIMRYISCLE